MKIVIFGATGATGKVLVKQALEQGHDVTAFVRNPAKLSFSHNRLRIYQGNILNKTSVAGAIQGQGAVLSTLGTRSLKKSTLLSEGIRQITTVMQEQNVKRFIYLTALGAGNSYARAPLFTRLAIRFLLKNIYADKVEQEMIIKESNLEWTIVRALTLTNGPKTAKYRTGEKLDVNSLSFISRSDVADCLLKQLQCDVYTKGDDYQLLADCSNTSFITLGTEGWRMIISHEIRL